MAYLKLTYPIYCADFDPHNSDFLFVGGGGGEGRSGVPNKISLLDTFAASKSELREVAHIDLSTNEDSVSSLAVAQSDASAATVYAGINSSQEQQKAGNNEHLRSIKVPYPRKKIPGTEEKDVQAAPKPSALGKASLFTATEGGKAETYQRVLRLSPLAEGSNRRLGAVATGLAPKGEVVLFDNAGIPEPSADDIRHRIQLKEGEEASGVDFIDTQDGLLFAYATETIVYVLKVPSAPGSELPDATAVFTGSKRDGSIKVLRFLTENHILLIRNFPRRSGAQIMILNFPTELDTGRVAWCKALPKGFNAATAMDVAILPTDDAAASRQFLMATAGQNGSLILYTIGHTPNAARRFQVEQHTVYRDIHPAGMTCVSFSKPAASPESSESKRLTPLKLASTSFGNTVVVQSLPLKRKTLHPNVAYTVLATDPQSNVFQEVRTFLIGAIVILIVSVIVQALTELGGYAKNDRLGVRHWAPPEIKYLFNIPPHPDDPYAYKNPVMASSMPPVEPAAAARAASKKAAKAASSATNTAGSAISEAIASMKHAASDIPSAEDIEARIREEVPSIEEITQHIQDAAASATKAAVVDSGAQKVLKAPDEARKKSTFKKIRSLLHAHHRKDDQPAGVSVPAAIMFRDSPTGLTVSTHEHEDHPANAGARRWEHLSDEERQAWKQRLSEAGHWAEGETEKVLKGVFFGAVAGMVGAAVRAA